MISYTPTPDFYNDYICHYGVKGMKWGVRRYQKPNGSLTSNGKKRHRVGRTKIGDRSVKNNKVSGKKKVSKSMLALQENLRFMNEMNLINLQNQQINEMNRINEETTRQIIDQNNQLTMQQQQQIIDQNNQLAMQQQMMMMPMFMGSKKHRKW